MHFFPLHISAAFPADLGPSDLWVDPAISLGPVPEPDEAGSRLCPPFVTGPKTRDGRHTISTGRSGILVDEIDFHLFQDYVEEHLFEAEAAKKKAHREKVKAQKSGKTDHVPVDHVPYRPTSQVIDFGLSILWPGQTYSSITLFRGRTSRRLSAFHTERFHALAGNESINDMLFILSIMLFVKTLTVQD